MVRSQVAKESGTTSTSLNSVAVTMLQQFEDNIRKQLSELSSLEEGLSPERYKASFPPMEKEQRYIMSDLLLLCSSLTLLSLQCCSHDVITDFPNLQSFDEGEGVERYQNSLHPLLTSHCTMAGILLCIGMGISHQRNQ